MPITTQKTLERYHQMLEESEPFFLKKNYTIEDFAVDLGINRTYASKFVNKELGMSFPQLLCKLRLALFMKKKQSNPALSFNAIIKQCGFNDKSCFRRAFVSVYGMNPSEYFDSRQ